MPKVNAISKLLGSIAVLLFAVACLVFAINTGVKDASAVAVGPRTNMQNRVFTQSANGKTLYQWVWSTKKKQWQYFANSSKATYTLTR